MSAALPFKKGKRSRPSTEVNNSFIKNLASRVSSLFSSTITKWFSSPSSSNTHGPATVAESSDSSTEDEASDGCTEPPAKRMCYAFERECKSPSTSNNYITPEMKCTGTNTEPIETFSTVTSPLGQSTTKTETHTISTSLLSPKEETTISEQESNEPVYNLHTPFSRHSFVEKRKSLFGRPAHVTEKLPPSNSFWDSQPHIKPRLIGSTFYSGKTRYGGAASSYTVQPNIKHRKDMLVNNSANNDSIMISNRTRHVMDLLEEYSSPLIEAKRISQFSRPHTKSLDNTIENMAHRTRELYVPKYASILHLKKKAKLMATTSAARQIFASYSSSPAFKPYPACKSHSNSLDPTSDKLTTKIKTRLTRFNRDEQKLNDSNTTVQLPTVIIQNKDYDLPKFTLEMSVAKTSTTSETLFTSTAITEAGRSNRATNVATSAGDKTETYPTIVIMKDDNESMNINEVSGNPQHDYLYKFSRPDMVLDESIQNSSLIPNYVFGSPERQAIVQSTEKQNKKEKCIDKEKKEEKEVKESAKLITIASENNIDKQSGKRKCENCWVFNNLDTERCICCDSKVLGKSNIDNTKCTGCKIASRQEHNDKCIECEIKIKKIDILTIKFSSKWKCEYCWEKNDQDVTKCVCCGRNNNLLSSGSNTQSDEWKCEECWIKNKNNFVNCVACGGPKPAIKEIPSKDVVPPSSTANTITNNDTLFSSKWKCEYCWEKNDQDVTKCVCCGRNNNLLSSGSNSQSDEWKCEECWIKNKNNFVNCVACGGPKPAIKEIPSKDVVPPSSTANTITNNDTLFSSKWKCEYCWEKNDQDVTKCVCCGRNNNLLSSGSNTQSDEWKCEECWIKNKNNFVNCVACGGLKPAIKEIPSKDVVPPSSTANTITNNDTLFSSKWKCEYCWEKNDQDVTKCVCCGRNNNLLSSGSNTQSDEWKCEECWIKNKNNFVNCVACGGPKPAIKEIPSKDVVPPSSTANTITNNDTLFSSKWKCEYCWVENDQDVTKCVCCGRNNNLLSSGSNSQSDEWKCEECWIKNKNNFGSCVACGGPKPATKEITSKDVVPPSSTTNTVTKNDTLLKKNLKPQSGQWECPNCLVRNDDNRSKCNCCDAVRPGMYKEVNKKRFNFGSVQNTTFKFGIAPSENIPLTKPKLSSVTQFKVAVTESETNNNIVPEPLKFNFGIPKPKSINNIITEEESIAEDRTPPPEETFKFGLSTVSTTANVFSNSAIPVSKYTESMLISNLKEADEKVQEVPDIEEPNSFVSVNGLKPGQLFGSPLNNSSAESSMQALTTFGTAGQSTNEQAKQAVTTTVEDTKVPLSTFSFPASSIKPAVNLFSSTVITTSTSSIPFSTAPKNPTPTISFFQKNEVTPNQTFFPKNTMTPSTVSLFNKNETMTTTVAASPNVQIFSFGGNNPNIQTEKPKFNFTFGNKSEIPSLFTSPMSNTNTTMPENVMAENTIVSGTVMSGGNGLPTGNPSLGGNGLPLNGLPTGNPSSGGNGLPLNSLSSGLLAGPTKKDGMWPLNSDLDSFKMTSGSNIETSVNNLSSIQPGSLFVTQPKNENTWPTNQNVSNDSMGTLKLSSGNNLEPITDPLGLPTGRLFGAPEKKDTMWSPNNNNANNMFGTNPSTNNLQKSTSFTFGSTTMQFNSNGVTPTTFGSSIQPAQNIFGIANQNNNNPTLFSHPIQHQTPPNIFGAQQINNSTLVGMFGPPNVAGSPRFGTSNPPISTFEASQLNSMPTQPTFNFGAQQTTGVFGFGQQQPSAQSGVYNFGAQNVGPPQRQFNIGTASAPNMVGRRVIRKAVRRTTQR